MEEPSPPRDTGVGRNGEPTTGMPRWVKVSGVAAIVVVVIFVLLLLTGGPGRHGPGRHIGGLRGVATVDAAAVGVPSR